MKKSIELKIDIDLEKIAEDSDNRDGAFTMLNYQLEKSRKKFQKELQNRVNKVKAEFEKELERVLKEK